MKKVLSFVLALTLCLGLLPTAALAAGNTYSPDEEGWGYVTSEKVIDLGEIENDGTEKEMCGSFTVTIENTGTQPLAGGTVTFDDSGSVAGWALTAVGEMQRSGIMSGTGNNLFSPQMSYTREQSVVTIVRMYELLKQ